MASVATSKPIVSDSPPALKPMNPLNSTFAFPATSSNHNYSQPSITHSKPPSDFVFPRRPPSTGNIGSQARPRSSITDASVLLAEIGVAPPPSASTSNMPRHPSVPYFPNGVRPHSMVTTTQAPSMSLAPSPGSRIGHRRGASELVGVEKSFDASKSECEGDKKSPQPGPRRGHAHRRSGAISSGDILGLLSQSTPSLLLTSSPEKEDKENDPSNSTDAKPVSPKSQSAPVSPDMVLVPPFLPDSTCSLDANFALRRSTKVAFTDRVEIIPRPLSTSTIGSGLTVRPNHNGADSISSLGSFGSPISRSPSVSNSRSPTRSRSNSISTQTNPLPPELLQEITQRPSTAGAILGSPKPRPRSNEALPPPSTDSSSPHPPCSTSEDSAKTESGKKHKRALSDSSPHASSSHEKVDKPAGNVLPRSKSRKSKKAGKRKKKQIKSWLETRVLGKNGKNRSQTPPTTDETLDWKTRDEATPGWAQSYVLMPEISMAGRSLEELSSTMSPRLNGFSNGSSPIIDLDAALAPLNSASPGLGGRSAGFTAAKRTMHSSGAGGRMSIGSGIGSAIGGSGFGASFIGSHRRSESMPEMPLFTLSEEDRMTMEDVFEEDEDEEDDEDTESEDSDDETSNEPANTEGLGIDIKVVDAEGMTTWERNVKPELSPRLAALPAPIAAAGNGRRGSLAPSLSKGSLTNESIIEEDETEEAVAESGKVVTPSASFDKLGQVCNDSSSSRCATPTSAHQSAQSSTSTVTAVNPSTSSPQVDPFDTRTRSSSLATSSFTGIESPSSSPSTPQLGPLSTPVCSFPMPTIKKLAAEIAAEEGQYDPYADSPLHFLGEPGPEMRTSVDDVPSLTSSRSTMTSSYAAYFASQPPTPLREEITASLSKKSKSGKRKWMKLFKFWEGRRDKEKKEEKKEKEKHKEKSRSSAKVANSSVSSLLR